MINQSIKKLVGTPHNLSDGSGQRKTQAASLPKIDSSIAGGKFTSHPNATEYGVAGIGKDSHNAGGGSGGSRSQNHVANR
ncbi:MAG: hypothetical protein DRP64_00020 [Verrucomicrobia bacterium]|nr:MAG: hypothetical protein DRP64_00020 [Verrucomicrobiota bacterium]